MKWLNSKEAAEYARVSPGVIRDAAQEGHLSGVKVSPGSAKSEWRFKDTDIDRWLERGRVGVVPVPRRLRRAS